MPNVLHFYMDDSGTRHPDRHPGSIPAHAHDWFALGGVLIDEKDEEQSRADHADFCERWQIDGPLHSYDIRNRSGAFTWLGKLEAAEYERFIKELSRLLTQMQVLGLACIIDRPGYNARYREKYGRRRWLLCKTAFSVSIERAAKFARAQNSKLKVFVERSDKHTDRRVSQYYQDLRSIGMPFDQGRSGKYTPLTSVELARTLYDFKLKRKSSPIMQIADLYLWPMAIGGYDPGNRPYAMLRREGKLIDCTLRPNEIPALGIKYSCWEVEGRPTA